MEDIINEIKIPDTLYSFISDYIEEDVLMNLSKINIFVGENNSGKSRFLRSIISKKSLQFMLNNEDFDKINENIELLKINFQTFSNKFKFDIGSKIPNLEKTLNRINKVDFLTDNENFFQPFLDLKEILKELKERKGIFGDYYEKMSMGYSFESVTYEWVGNELIKIIEDTFNLNKPFKEVNLSYNLNKIYIPILRGLRPLLKGQDYQDLYKERTEESYFKEYLFDPSSTLEKNNITIFTGLNVYKTIRSHLLGNLKQRRLIEEFQEYLSEQFFDEKPIALIPQDEGDKILIVKIGDEIERPIFELGDGIQSIIIMTLPLFLHKDNIEINEKFLIFIEEPEHLLHPGLQRKLIDTFFDEKFDKFQFFITTHSNHFLDIILDYKEVSIFSLRKKLDEGKSEEKNPKFSIESLSYGDTNVLELLGVRNTSVFLSNCTIWVEGITDRYYIRKYFDVYQEYLKKEADDKEIEFMEFREDYHYSFVEYSGGNITHWSFLDDEEEPDEENRINVDRLCSKLFLIADSDNKIAGAKAERHKKLKEKLKNRFYLLKSKEIENILSKNVLLEVIKDYECKEDRKTLDYEDSFTEEEYQKDCLGEFIENRILKGERNRRGSYQKKNNDGNCVTITDKTNFCKYALNHINTFEDLSNEAKEICNSLYQFIAVENGYDRSNYMNICEELGLPYEIIDFKDNGSKTDISEEQETLEAEETETEVA